MAVCSRGFVTLLLLGIPFLLKIQGALWYTVTNLGFWLCREWVGKVLASAFSRGVWWKLEAAHN